jgi:predicted acylesterase/phospholipase RssA
METSWSRHADVLLEPQVQHIDWNDFSRVDEAFSAGALAARRALPFLRELLERTALVTPSGMSFPPEKELAL